jgi:exopolyphosphatase
LVGYLQERKQLPTQLLVIGNTAGDADSVISAIALAYIESGSSDIKKTPIVAIPKVDLQTLRPDIKLLLELAGITAEQLIFADDPLIVQDTVHARLTLTDHNSIEPQFQTKNWTVVEIVDHHQDQGLYLDTCSGLSRTIAFANDTALVASACTLVAERLKAVQDPPYPAPLGLLLLGVILLDSVNLAADAGKATQRDVEAVKDLLTHTKWSDLPRRTLDSFNLKQTNADPHTTPIFNMLQDVKYDRQFWKSVSIRDALRYDYKQFGYATGQLGICTVPMPAHEFLSKANVTTAIHDYISEVHVNVLGIMFASINGENRRLKRQLVLYTQETCLMDVVRFLLLDSGLGLVEMKPRVGEDPNMRVFHQNNIQMSRKQIAPLLIKTLDATQIANW